MQRAEDDNLNNYGNPYSNQYKKWPHIGKVFENCVFFSVMLIFRLCGWGAACRRKKIVAVFSLRLNTVDICSAWGTTPPSSPPWPMAMHTLVCISVRNEK